MKKPNKDFFIERPKVNPTIYAYELPGVESHKGYLKVGYTDRNGIIRTEEQLKTIALKYKLVLDEPASREDGSFFRDKDVHRILEKNGCDQIGDSEFYKCTKNDVLKALHEIKTGEKTDLNRVNNFKMRPEQANAVKITSQYFKDFKKKNKDKIPHFLWNAKMRFGKTFASYQLAKKMKWKKVLVLTFKPAVENAWEEDLNSHIDFKDWQFISKKGLSLEEADQNKPIICFGSFQDYLGTTKQGAIKPKNELVHKTNWDCVIFDEYHFGAWRENAKELFEAEGGKELEFGMGKGQENIDEDILPIKTDHYLYLSGTPFRAIANGEFIEEQIFNWTYSDEQNAKEKWEGENNPYAELPRMVLLTYQLPDAIRQIAMKGEKDGFDLNEFFAAEGTENKARFKYEEYVQKWLDLIRGAFKETNEDFLKMGIKKPVLPFSHPPLLEVLNHTFWFLPSVASCYAMANLLRKRNNTFYHDYRVIVAAGTKAGIGMDALKPVRKEMSDNSLETKTITLSCGKLTTGVTVKQWTGIFMLRNSSSPETYFQAAFRVQSPWVLNNPDGKSPNEKMILKNECYVFDFAPNRALRQIADYSMNLDVEEKNPEKKVANFINFLPVLAYDGTSMRDIDARGILDMAISGTTATLLARRWESALLVNVDNFILEKILNDENVLKIIQNITGFRNLNQDIETIISRADEIKKLKKEASEKDLSSKKKKELSEKEKEFKSKRKEIQDKLIKFATRIPIFMYLSEYREIALEDVITKLEPKLFKKVTGLTIADFDLLVSLGLFNKRLMDQSIFYFRRYEDASLEYLGINKRDDDNIGLFSQTISKEEYLKEF